MKLRNIWKVISTYLFRKTFPIICKGYRIYRRIPCWYVDLCDQWYIKQAGPVHLPPAYLRDRVQNSPGIDTFLEAGKKCSQDIKTTLMGINKDLGLFRNILDFGCGCGRTLRWFADHSQSSDFYGTDIDIDAISWCRNNLNFASFDVNKPLPPLKYPPEMFDLIYAISVFTHLDENHQFCWLGELKRILKTKGILLLTVHGRYCWENLPYKYVAKIEKAGFIFITSWKNIFPQGHQAAYHTKDYVFAKYAKFFDILNYIPRGLNNHQDMIVLQKT